MRALREHREPDLGDRVEVAHTAVGDDAGCAAGTSAQREDVTERACGRIAAGLDHDDLALVDGVERALLGVVAASVGPEEVFTERDEAQRLGRADDLAARDVRGHPVDEARVVSSFAQLRREACGGGLEQLGAQLGGEGRRCRLGGQAGLFARPPGLGALQVVDGRKRSEIGVEGHVALCHRRDEAAGGRRARCIRCIDLDLDHVTRDDHGGPSGGAGEDDVAGFEREVLREIRDELSQREDESGRGVVLTPVSYTHLTLPTKA